MTRTPYDAWRAVRSRVEPGGDFTDRVMERLQDAAPPEKTWSQPKSEKVPRSLSPPLVAASVVGCVMIGLLQSAFVIGFLLLNCSTGF